MWPITPAFRQALGQEVQEVRAKIEILNSDFQPVYVVGGGGPDKSLIDGVVDVDVSRGTRRTAVFSLLNQDGEFSPTSDWGGLFYVNRLIRLYRGLVVGGSGDSAQVEYMPIGTFMVDRSEVLVERSMSTVVFSASDLWKKLNKSQFVEPTSFNKGTLINDFIGQLADQSGVTKLALDPLSNRTSLSNRLQSKVTFEKGDTRGDALKKVCGDFGIDIYFDPAGVLSTEDTRTPASRAPVWEYGYTTAYPALAYMLRTVTDDDRLYNSVYVTGTADPEHLYTAELTNTDPASPINVDRIGRRVYRMESGVLGSQESVNLAAQSLFHTTSIFSQSVNMEAICLPALEGNDIISAVETEFSGVSGLFTLKTFSVPLLSGKQKITMDRIINVNPT